MFGSLGGEFPLELGEGDALPSILLGELVAAYGSAFSRSQDGVLWSQCHAEALTLYSSWCATRAAFAQHNPATATDQLPIWENELGVNAFALPIALRQRRAAEQFARLGRDTSFNDLDNLLHLRLGDTYVAMRTIHPNDANVHVPDGTYPWGSVTSSTPWSSTASYIAVHLQRVTGVPVGAFLERVGDLREVLEPRLESWATYDWYLAEGFTLDEDNLDIAVFDE